MCNCKWRALQQDLMVFLLLLNSTCFLFYELIFNNIRNIQIPSIAYILFKKLELLLIKLKTPLTSFPILPSFLPFPQSHFSYDFVMISFRFLKILLYICVPIGNPNISSHLWCTICMVLQFTVFIQRYVCLKCTHLDTRDTQ